jgi:hypothetical protein
MKRRRCILTGLVGMAFLFAGFDILPQHYDQQYDAMTSATRLTPPEDRGYLGYPVRIMNKSTYNAYQFDPAAGKPATISYSVSRSGWVRVRLVRRDDAGIVLRTMQNWKLSHYGQTYQLEWDGNDASGNPVDRQKMFVAFEARDSAHDKIHRGHSMESCRDPVIIIERSGAGSTGSAIEKIVVAFEQEALNTDNHQALKGRLYVDFELAEEVLFPPGAKQIIFEFDTGKLAGREPLLSVNIDDGEDHVGTASLRLSTDDEALDAARLLSIRG